MFYLAGEAWDQTQTWIQQPLPKMSVLSTGLQLQVFSFPWQGARAKTQTSVNPRRGLPQASTSTLTDEGEVRSPCCHRWLCTSGSCSVTEHLVWAPFRKLKYARTTACLMTHSNPAPWSYTDLSEAHKQISHKYHEKRWLQSAEDGAEIRAPIMKEVERLSFLVYIRTILFWAEGEI